MNYVTLIVILVALALCAACLVIGYKIGYGKNQSADIKAIVQEMKANSADWNTSDQVGRIQLSAKNTALGSVLPHFGVNAVYEPKTGVWYIDKVGGEKLYDKY